MKEHNGTHVNDVWMVIIRQAFAHVKVKIQFVIGMSLHQEGIAKLHRIHWKIIIYQSSIKDSY